MRNVYEFLKSSAEKYPDRVLFDDSTPYTYETSIKTVKSIACYLHNLGIKNERILVNVGRDARTVLLFLGIALSGNCYVPGDESYPEERKHDIISIGEITYGFDIEGLGGLKAKEAMSTEIDEAVVASLEADFDENAPLCLLFTSGSTGKPKGVMKSHKNVIAFVRNFLDTFHLDAGARICNQTPFSFDASAKDIYLTLALGGSLFIPDKTKFALPKIIVDYLNEKEVDTILWVPTALTSIAKTRTLNFVKPTFLKNVFFIGEVFPPKYLNMWVEAMPNTHFVNLYGSTELAGACLYYEITKPMPIDQPLPTGKAISGNEVILKDGEICVNSDQVALGYYGDEAKTNATFKMEDGKRYLHTGDYACYNEEGDIVFHARKDFQIKRSGYRIELQDIEAALSSLDYLGDICCLYDENRGKIVLFVTLSYEIDGATTKILADARVKLPYYMVPNVVKVLPSMPLNANGKIDRVGLKNSL